MSYVGITIEILEYYPLDFKFDNFSFIFSTETRDFEKEITFASKNSISHKILIPRKNLKYSIKITRNNSLIGISDFIIPFQLFSKKENSFNKNCQLTMTDSIRKLIFGNTPSNNIKISVNADFKYLEKGEKFIKPTISNSHIKKEEKKEKRASTPKKFENKFKNKYGNLTTILKLSRDEKSMMNKKVTEDLKKRSNTKPHVNNISGNESLNSKAKHQKKEKPKDNIINSKKLKEFERLKNKEKEKLDNNNNKIINNIDEKTDIDESLKNNQPIISQELLDFMKNLEQKYPLKNLDKFNDQYELMNYTKNIMNELLNYQKNYYSVLNASYTLNKRYQNLLLNYNEKYRLTLKKINKIEEESKKNEIKEDIINIKENNDNNTNINHLLSLKQQELDLFKEIYVIKPKKKEEEKLSDEQLKQIEEKKYKDQSTQLLLIKVLKNIYNKFGPLNKILTKENSDSDDIDNIINLSSKYNLPISKEILKLENIVCDQPEEFDSQLDLYLTNLYKNKKMNKMAFKKIGNNLYEYGNAKVTIEFEKNIFKAKTKGEFIDLDKFIEKNGGAEENKMKNSESSKNKSNKKKK